MSNETPIAAVAEAQPKSKADVRVEQWKAQKDMVSKRIAEIQQELGGLQQQALMLDGAIQAYDMLLQDLKPELPTTE